MAGNKTNKNRKYGRNLKDCQTYKVNSRWGKNKMRRMLRTFKRQPHNATLASRIMAHHKDTPGFRVGADILSLCKGMVG